MKPYRIIVPDSAIKDLHARIDRTRWPARHASTPWALGTDGEYLRSLLDYWRHKFDWGRVQEHLNTFRHFTATIAVSSPR